MTYQIAPDFCLPSRRGNRRIASYVTVAVTRKASKKTSKMVFHLTEIALVLLYDFDAQAGKVPDKFGEWQGA